MLNYNFLLFKSIDYIEQIIFLILFLFLISHIISYCFASLRGNVIWDIRIRTECTNYKCKKNNDGLEWTVRRGVLMQAVFRSISMQVYFHRQCVHEQRVLKKS